MIRKAFRMSLNPGSQAEYARRHNPIWAELDDLLRRHGVERYSIFLDPDTNDLFAYAEIESDERWAAIAGTEVCRRWWRSMRELMPSQPDGSPLTHDLREVFHLGEKKTSRYEKRTSREILRSETHHATSTLVRRTAARRM